jgi:hypothetical protein
MNKKVIDTLAMICMIGGYTWVTLQLYLKHYNISLVCTMVVLVIFTVSYFEYKRER